MNEILRHHVPEVKGTLVEETALYMEPFWLLEAADIAGAVGGQDDRPCSGFEPFRDGGNPLCFVRVKMCMNAEELVHTYCCLEIVI